MKKQRFKDEKYIRQRHNVSSNTYSFQVLIPYTDEKGATKQYSKTFNGAKYMSDKEAYEAAKLHRNEMLLKLDNDYILPKEIVTVDMLFNRVIENESISFKTQKKYKSFYKNYISSYCANTDITKLKPYAIQETLNKMVDDCTNDTIRYTVTIWKKIIKYALLDDLITIDPMIKITVPKSQYLHIKKSVDVNLNTVYEIINILENSPSKKEHIRFNDKILAKLIKLLLYTGYRPAEIYALKKSDVDLINKKIHVRTSVGSDRQKDKIIKMTKTEKSVRTTPLTEEMEKIILEVLEIQDEESEYLFADFKGNLLDTDAISNKISIISKKYNLKFNLYMLRHKLATDMVKEGIDIRTIMDIMGHASPSMTLSYARTNEDEIKAAFNRRKLKINDKLMTNDNQNN